jgi:sugar/nucleoside kinase (ribokinase family)
MSLSLSLCSQWTLQTPKTAAFIGCVGNDANAATLRKVAEAAGAELLYLVDPTEPTGRCAVLLNGKNRSGATARMAPQRAWLALTNLGIGSACRAVVVVVVAVAHTCD